jgi:hypothetical protein
MTEDQFFAIIDPVLKSAGAVPDEGEEYREPPLDVLRYYRRPVRLSWVPLVGRGLSVVAVARQPVDVGFSAGDYRRFLTRLAMAVNTRYPPWGRGRGLALGLTGLVLTPEPIGPDDDKVLAAALGGLKRVRAVPLGLIRLNLGQEAVAFSLTAAPDRLFPEPEALADALALRFRRFVPLVGS